MSIRDAGTTIRPSSTSLLTIDSEDRFADWNEKRDSVTGQNNYNPYDFTLIREAPLVNGYMTRIALTEVSFPWNYPNINARTSLINVEYTFNGIQQNPFVLSVPLGFYAPVTLASKMLSLLNSAGATNGGLASFTYGNDKLPRFTYECNAGYRIRFYPMTSNQNQVLIPGGTAKNIYPYPDTTKQLFDVLGFTYENRSFTSTIGGPFPTVKGYGQATLAQAVRYIDICSPQLTANQGLIDATSQTVGRNALCRLYIGDLPLPSQFANIGQVTTVPDANTPYFTPPGCEPMVIYRQFSTPKYVAWNAFMPINGRIQFQVYDDNGQLLTPVEKGLGLLGEVDTTFSAYTDWSITLLISEN